MTDLQVLTPDGIGSLMRAEIDMQISTAKAYPRSIKSFMNNALSAATLSAQIADKCSYALERGGKLIIGPSVRLSEIAFSTYGNCRGGARVVEVTHDTVTAEGVFHDLESNSSLSIKVSRSIMQHETRWDEPTKKKVRTGKMVRMNEDMILITSNAAVSFAFRNAVSRGLRVYIDVLHEEIRKVAKGDVSTLPAKRKRAVDFFQANGISVDQVCEYFDVKHVDDLNIDHVELMAAMVNTFKDHQDDGETLKAIFTKQEQKKEEKEAKKESKKEAKEAEELFRQYRDRLIIIDKIEEVEELRKSAPTHKFTHENAAIFLQSAQDRIDEIRANGTV